MNTETRNCQNCKTDFLIEPDDFGFYAKMQVPPPTFCPGCRFQRRLMFKNDRNLYKRDCAMCGASVLTMFAPESRIVVYCQPCWWSDKWDAGEYGQDYDPSKPFFLQVQELYGRVPLASLSTGYSTMVNSEYVNEAAYAKNCYLIFNADYNENVLYATTVDHSKDSMDANMLESSELCYETIGCEKCYRAYFSEDCVSCTNIYFSKNLSGCSDCFGCVNLRNKRYHIWNEPYSKEEYEKKLAEMRMGSAGSIEGLRRKAYEFWRTAPMKYMQGVHNVNVSGDYIWESKNAHYMYQARSVEDGKYSQFMTMGPLKDIMDHTQWGNGAQRIYECLGAGEGADMIRFCSVSWSSSSNNEYCFYAISSAYQFGCVGTRKKKFCILNKQYSEEGYNALRERIIRDMNERPYVDEQGRVWRYGEFFPYKISPYAYNESGAMEYFPLSREEVESKGWRWREPTPGAHQPTMLPQDVPDDVKDAPDSISKEILQCGVCGRAYRIIPQELALLRRFELALPRNCPDCRHRARLERINPPKLWSRQCAKCGAGIETSYSPDRPEIVYCEACYQQEVA